MLKAVIIGHEGHTFFALNAIDKGCGCEIAGYAPSPNKENEESLALEYNAEYFDDYIDMLDETKPDIAIINPEFSYISKCTKECITRGINIFCEKPLALTLKDLDELEKAAESGEARICAMMGMRYEAPFFKLKQLIEDGILGNIRLIHAQKSYKLGNRPDFYKKRDTYGGTIPWVGSHPIDMVYWLSGRKKYKSVCASHSSLAKNGHGELETSAALLLEMEDEVFATVNIDYLRPENSNTHGDDRIRVVGDKSWAEVVGSRLYLEGDEITLPEERNIFSEFCAEIEGTGNCTVKNTDSLYVTRICLMARESADSNKQIYIKGQ